MAKLTLYAYAQGTDLDGVASTIEERLDALVAGRTWRSKDVWVVNQHDPATPTGDPETWDLGVNLALPAKKTRAADWVEDLVAIATVFGALNGDTARTFVLGIHDSKSGATTDVFFIDNPTPDLEALRTAFGSL